MTGKKIATVAQLSQSKQEKKTVSLDLEEKKSNIPAPVKKTVVSKEKPKKIEKKKSTKIITDVTDQLPEGLNLVKNHSLESMDEKLKKFSDWNKEILRDRAFFGYEIDYSQPEAPIFIGNMEDDLPSSLKDNTDSEFNCLIVEKFEHCHKIGRHTLSEVCGPVVYTYFSGEDCNLLLYKIPEGEEWDKFVNDKEEYNQKRSEINEKIEQKMEEISTENADVSSKEKASLSKEVADLKIQLLKLYKPRFNYEKIDLFIPKGTLLEMNLEFRKHWEISIPMRINVYKKGDFVRKEANYKLFTMTFSQYDVSLFKEYVPREESE